VAKLKKGDSAGGNADIASAKAIEHNIDQKYADYGVIGASGGVAIVSTAAPSSDAWSLPGCLVAVTNTKPNGKYAAIIAGDAPRYRTMAKSARGYAEQHGTKIRGEMFYPVSARDFSVFIVQAKLLDVSRIIVCGPSDGYASFTGQAYQFNLIE
jgi:hypothetical protein